MRIRAYTPEEDTEELFRIWKKFFKDEFDFPDFAKGYICAVTIKDDNNDIILSGGVRPIAELLCVTNKDIKPRDRVVALKALVEASKYFCKANRHDQLHCFVQGDDWSNQVQTIGFRPTKGQALVLDIG